MPAARRRLATVATLAVVTLVGGCSDEPEPRFAEPSESASATLTEETTADPDQQRAQEREFLTTYFGLISDSISTGDPTPWLKLSPDCTSCATIASNLRDGYRNGGSIEGGRWDVVSARFVEEREIGSVWAVSVKTSRENWLSQDGEVVKIVTPDRLDYELALRQEGPSPVVVALGRQS